MLARTSSNHSQPFTIGVLADLIGSPNKPLWPMKQRRLVEVTEQSIPVYRAHLERTFGSTSTEETESAWAGLRFLTAAVAGRPEIKVKVLAASKRDVFKDLQRAVEYDQSALYKHVYTAQAGTFGGEPVCCLVADYRFTPHSDDFELLDRMLPVAAAAYAPLLHGMTTDFMEALTGPELVWSRPNECRERSSVVHRWDEHRQSPVWRFSFPLYPEVRTAESLINPAYLMAGIIANAVAEGSPVPFLDDLLGDATDTPTLEAEVEADYPHPWGTLLARSGITLLTRQKLSKPGDLVASTFSSGVHPDSVIGWSLAETSFICWIWRNLADLVRTRRASFQGFELRDEMASWLTPRQHRLTRSGMSLLSHQLTIEDCRLQVLLRVDGHSLRASDYHLTFDFHPNPAERVTRAIVED